MTIDKSVFIPVDPDTAFALITRPERLRRWQAVAARVDLRVGGEYRWTITPGHSAAGTFTEIEPGKRIVFTWDWEGSTASAGAASTVTITLDSVDGGTNVRLVHEGLSPEAAAGHTEGWNHYFERLATMATTDDAGADDWAAAPDPINELISAEATLAIVQRRGRRPRNTISPQMRGRSFANETLVEESAASMDRLVAFTGRQVAAN